MSLLEVTVMGGPPPSAFPLAAQARETAFPEGLDEPRPRKGSCPASRWIRMRAKEAGAPGKITKRHTSAKDKEYRQIKDVTEKGERFG